MGEFLETWEKGWVSFWQETDKLGKLGKSWVSFWEGTDKLSESVGSVVGLLGSAPYNPPVSAFKYHSWVTLLPRYRRGSEQRPAEGAVRLTRPGRGPDLGLHLQYLAEVPISAYTSSTGLSSLLRWLTGEVTT